MVDVRVPRDGARIGADPGRPPRDSGANGRVVVGVSGSDASVVALAWALDLARRRGWTVDVVAVWPDLLVVGTSRPDTSRRRRPPSVAELCRETADCPTVVVGEPPPHLASSA